MSNFFGILTFFFSKFTLKFSNFSKKFQDAGLYARSYRHLILFMKYRNQKRSCTILNFWTFMNQVQSLVFLMWRDKNNFYTIKNASFACIVMSKPNLTIIVLVCMEYDDSYKSHSLLWDVKKRGGVKCF